MRPSLCLKGFFDGAEACGTTSRSQVAILIFIPICTIQRSPCNRLVFIADAMGERMTFLRCRGFECAMPF